MPNFNVTPVIPSRVNEESLETLQMNFWVNTVTNDAQFREAVHGSPEPNHDFLQERYFMLTDMGTLSKIDLWDEAADYGTAAWAGRLFVMDKNNDLRQLTLSGEGDNMDISLSTPLRDVSSFAAPEGLPFWKYLLFPFFMGEISEYNRQAALHKAMSSTLAKDSFDIARGQQPRSAVQRQEEQRVAEGAESLKDFEARITEYSHINNRPTFVGAAMKKPEERTEAHLKEVLFLHARSRFAAELLKKAAKDPDNRMQILQEGRDTFDAQMEAIREFLPRLYDPAELKLIAEKGLFAGGEVIQRMDSICETSVMNYENYLRDGENFKQILPATTAEHRRLKEQGLDSEEMFVEPLGQKKPVDPLTQFQTRLEGLANGGPADYAHEAMQQENCTKEAYFNGIGKNLEREAAKQMLSKLDPNNPEQNKVTLAQGQKSFDSMVKDLKQFATQKLDGNLVNAVIIGGRTESPLYADLQGKQSALVKSSLSGYHNELVEEGLGGEEKAEVKDENEIKPQEKEVVIQAAP